MPEAKLANVVCSEGVHGSRASQEAAEVWAARKVRNFISLILQRLDNFEWGVNFLKLALDLAALPLSVGAPSIEALVLRQKQVMIFSCSDLQDLAVLKLRHQKRRGGAVQLPVVEAKLAKFI